MEAQKVDMFLMINSKYFESYMITQIRDRLLQMDDSKFIYLQTIDFKEPTTALIISLLGGGHLGIDRFYLGDVGLGIAKLLTCGGFMIWTVVDWFLIMGRAREVNFQKIQMVLM